MSTSLLDFTELLHRTGLPLPDLQGLHSQMAKVVLETVDGTVDFSPSSVQDVGVDHRGL
jgi:hypothetical protein